MNEGKQFEQDFSKSVPTECFYYRLRDGTAAWGEKTENVRFQQFNICDCMVFTNNNLFMLELKSHKGKSIPLSCIRQKQVEGLLQAYKKGVQAGFIFNFRDIEKTYYVNSNLINSFLATETRKSIPFSWVEEVGTLIPQQKMKVHYKYDLKELFVS